MKMRLRVPRDSGFDGLMVDLPAVPRVGEQLLWEESHRHGEEPASSYIVHDVYWNMDEEYPVLVLR